jgi:hypothetical protein
MIANRLHERLAEIFSMKKDFAWKLRPCSSSSHEDQLEETNMCVTKARSITCFQLDFLGVSLWG